MRRVIAGICVSAAAIAAAARPAAAATEIVLYASDAANLHGNWSLAADASTAGGQLLNSADNGWASAECAVRMRPATTSNSPSPLRRIRPSAYGSGCAPAASPNSTTRCSRSCPTRSIAQGSGDLPHRHDERAVREPAKLQRLRPVGLGLGRRRLLALAADDRLVCRRRARTRSASRPARTASSSTKSSSVRPRICRRRPGRL